jgi:hypothetical protein
MINSSGFAVVIENHPKQANTSETVEEALTRDHTPRKLEHATFDVQHSGGGNNHLVEDFGADNDSQAKIGFRDEQGDGRRKELVPNKMSAGHKVEK